MKPKYYSKVGTIPKVKSNWAEGLVVMASPSTRVGGAIPKRKMTSGSPVGIQAEPVCNGKIKQRVQKDSRPSMVKRWPKGKSYLTPDKRLTKEFKEFFRGFCQLCGSSSHVTSSCRHYQSTQRGSALCQCCRQGLHDECRHPMFRKSVAAAKRDNNLDKLLVITKLAKN